MATRQMNIKDENDADKLGKLPARKNGTEQTKRSALGELGNRTVFRTIKDGQNEIIESSKCQINLRNTKPRVDTNLKKIHMCNNNGLAIAANKKNVSRAKVQGIGTGNISSLYIPIQSKPKTNTVKSESIEINPTKIKYVNKLKSVEEKPQEELHIRREESNLTRRSLRALKAAISRDTKILQQQPKTVPIKKQQAVKKESGLLSATIAASTVTNSLKSDLKIVSVQSHSSKLLNLVDNIDADDTENPILVSEYVNDIYAYLYNLETELFIKENHLKDQEEVQPKMRAVLIDWLNEVHFQFHLAPETFHMTVAIIDRYLQAVRNTPRPQLQLVGVSALFIAAKYEELYPPPIVDFVYITDDTYKKEQILEMEIKVVKALKFNLARPLPIHFLRRFSKAARAEENHHEMAKYFLELASVEYTFASYKPSEIAAAALYLSLQLLRSSNESPDKLWTPTLEFYTRYTPERLKPVVIKLATLARNAPSAKLKAVYQKYQSTKLKKISLRPEIYGTRMDLLIAGE